MNVTKKERILYFDILRGLAILAVILCHVAGLYPFVNTSFKQAIPSFLNIIGLVGVPIFFMISGALLLNKDFTISEFLRKRFSRIVFPFIFWIVITIALGLIFFNYNYDFIVKLILGDNLYTWYIWVIMGIYLFIPIINSFVKEYSLKGLEYFLAIWFVTLILNTLGWYPFYRFELSYFSGFLGYFVLGFYLANKEFKLDSRILMICGFLMFAIDALILMYLNFNGIELVGSSYMNIFVVFESLGVFILVKELFKGKTQTKNNSRRDYFKKFIISVSVCSYSMYFTHKIVLDLIKTQHINSLKLLPVIFVVTVVLSWIISLIVGKLPYLGEISGVK